MTEERAPEIWWEFVKKVPHKGFYEKYSDSVYALAENAAALRTAADDNEKALLLLLLLWIDSPSHKKQLQANWKYSCVSCSKSACSQIFSNF
ncbi:hypothetical protein HYU93_02045 [Candidatus Daviesbacteria bacterium]|nr:hypothetical protein [Candidatus Daviesbacteria bacterium]